LTPTPNFGVGVEKANFLWENEKMAEFYEEKAFLYLFS
jgi:hypothetical protein